MPQFSTSSRAQAKPELIAHIPRLRAFALSFCGSADQADDLVQETLVKAWNHRGSFIEGTNMMAWLFTILRNVYYSQYRKRKREVPDIDGVYSSTLAVAPEQTSHMEMLDVRGALARLPADQREAVLLVGAAGHSYVQAAEICGCAVGTIKSRVNRARKALAKMLYFDAIPDSCPDSCEAADFTGEKIRKTNHLPRSPGTVAGRTQNSGVAPTLAKTRQDFAGQASTLQVE